MVEGGRHGARTVVRGRGRDPARVGDIADPSQSLPALRTRPLGGSVAAEESDGRCNHCPLRGRRRAGVPAPARSRAVPGAVAGAAGEVRAGIKLGEDAPDRIRALRRRAPEEAWSRQTGDLQLFGFCSHLWDELQGRLLRGPAKDHRQAHGSQAERNQGGAAAAHARVHRGHLEVVTVCGEGIFPISRHTGQRAATESVSGGRAAFLAASASAAESAEPLDLGALCGATRGPNSLRRYRTSLSPSALRRQTSKVGTVCTNCASTGAGREGSAPKSFIVARPTCSTERKAVSGSDRYLRGRADSPGSLAQGMLHRDGPGTEESSRFPPHEGRYVTPRVDRRGYGRIGSSRRNP